MASAKALLVGALATTIVLGGVSVVTAAPASATGGAGVTQTPSPSTPFLVSAKSNIAQLAQCGSTMYAVGSFSVIGLPGGHAYRRYNAFSFDVRTGRLTGWRPRTNGAVYSIALTSDCRTAYLGGSFTKVNSARHPYLAKVDARTGSASRSFAPNPNKYVSSVVRVGKRILVGGRFTEIGGKHRTILASVDGSTGAATSYLVRTITGVLPGESGPTRILKMDLSPTGKRLVAMGNFTRVSGHPRRQAFMLKLDGAKVGLSGWTSPAFTKACGKKVPQFVRDAAWSPDGRRIYLAATGGHGASAICDSASAYSAASASQKPLWINKTGCDSLYSIAADASTVYFGGHERWINNPLGCDKKGPGASDRPGIGAVAASNGHSLAWNPTRSRGIGADDMLRTSAGLWIASDNFYGSTKCGRKTHPGLCFFPAG